MTQLPYPFVSDDGRRLNAEAVQGNFDALADEAEPLALLAAVVGVAYTASSVTATVAVAHGFGRAPVSVVATVGNVGHVAHGAGDATQLTFFSETRDGSSITGPVSLNYVAVF